MKKVFQNILGGFFFGVGLAIAIFVFDKTKIFDTTPPEFNEMELRLTESIKAVLEDLDSHKKGNCEGMAGEWSGSRKEEEGQTTRSWNINFNNDGSLTGNVTFDSPTESKTDKQTGTWECRNSILFVTVNDERRNKIYNYLILTSEKNEKILSYIDRHEFSRTYLYQKSKP